MTKMQNKVLIAITVPTRHWKYVFKVRTDILVKELRKQVINSYNLIEMDYINYGLYLPPDGVKKGKFLQDERSISDYPQLLTRPADDNLDGVIKNGDQEPVLLELQPKVRDVEETRIAVPKTKRPKLKQNQKRLLSAIKRQDITRIGEILNQGLDPNFQCPSTGISPIGCASEQSEPREAILLLVSNGAHVDYRDAFTLTALHTATICGNLKAIEVLLELGQNPNVEDGRGLTPLYHACLGDTSSECVRRLLFDHATLGIVDDKGRQEIHQVCLNGRVQALKQLIIYGADLNAQAENENTPLHLCVLADEAPCLRLLLRYGASRAIPNAAGQTPYEYAVLIERMNLAMILKTFDDRQITPIDTIPMYNRVRRATIYGPRAALDTNLIQTDTINSNSNRLHKSRAFSLDQYNQTDDTWNERQLLINSRTELLNSYKSNGSSQYPIPAYNLDRQLSETKANFDETPDEDATKKRNVPIRQTKLITIPRGNSGYGFVMQGSENSNDSPGSPKQRIVQVQPKSKAHIAGLTVGDHILEVNGVDVANKNHTEVVKVIMQSGDRLHLKVLSPPRIYSSNAGRSHNSRFNAIRDQYKRRSTSVCNPRNSNAYFNHTDRFNSESDQECRRTELDSIDTSSDIDQRQLHNENNFIHRSDFGSQDKATGAINKSDSSMRINDYIQTIQNKHNRSNSRMDYGTSNERLNRINTDKANGINFKHEVKYLRQTSASGVYGSTDSSNETSC